MILASVTCLLYTTMAFKSVLMVALLFSVLILCLQGPYAHRIKGWGEWEGDHASASVSTSGATYTYADRKEGWEEWTGGHASASGATAGGFGNENWDRQGYGFSSGTCYEMIPDSGPKWCLTGCDDEEKQKKRAKANIKREGKSSREGDDEERAVGPRKKRFEWTKPLREKFAHAIAHSGLDKATPEKILEFMNEPGLTSRNVSSHLQKERDYRKEWKDAADAGDENRLDKLSRSSFAFGHPEPFVNNNEGDHHSQLLKQQQTGTSIGSAFQPSAGIGSTLLFTAAASNNHSSNQFSNYHQSSTGGDDEEKQKKRAKVNIKREGKSSREGDDEERAVGPRKKRFEWTKPLREKFAHAIAHFGLDKATPKKILEFMNEPGLTSRNVSSHLQKARDHPKKLKDAADKRKTERIEHLSRSSFAFDHPELFVDNNERDQHQSAEIYDFQLLFAYQAILTDQFTTVSLQHQQQHELVGSTTRQSLNLFESEEDDALFRTFLKRSDDVYEELIPLFPK